MTEPPGRLRWVHEKRLNPLLSIECIVETLTVSECVDVQADLSLCQAQSQLVVFVIHMQAFTCS